MNANFIIKNKNSIALSLLLLINSLLIFYNDLLLSVYPIKTEFVNVFIIIMYFFLGLVERVNRNTEIETIRLTTKNTNETVGDISQKLSIIDRDYNDFKVHNKTKHKNAEKLAKLINEGLIDIETINKNIPDKKIISVFCYQKSPILPQEIKKIMDKTKYPRKYPDMFIDLGFVRLANSLPYYPYFIVAEDKVLPRLRNVGDLGDYLISKGKLAIDEEWADMLESLKNTNVEFYNNKKNANNPLNLSMLITKSTISNTKHCFLKTNSFNKDFSTELAFMVETNKLKLSNHEKVKIKNFSLQSSIDILIEHVPCEDKQKIMSLEKIFKKPVQDGGLGIVYFFDYYMKNKNDMVNMLTKCFDRDKAETYTDMLINNSREYAEVMFDLRIGI